MENDQKSTIWENPSIIFRQSSNLLTLAATNKCVQEKQLLQCFTE